MSRQSDKQRLAEYLHTLRMMISDLTIDRPNCAEADNHIDDFLCVIDDAQAHLAMAHRAVAAADYVADALESGDMVEGPGGIVYARDVR